MVYIHLLVPTSAYYVALKVEAVLGDVQDDDGADKRLCGHPSWLRPSIHRQLEGQGRNHLLQV